MLPLIDMMLLTGVLHKQLRITIQPRNVSLPGESSNDYHDSSTVLVSFLRMK